jgi:hypothetical protein
MNQSQIEISRDDGPLARALGRWLGRAVPLAPTALIALGVLVLVAVIAIAGDDAADWVPGVLVAWLLLTAGVSSGRPHTERLRWMIPSLLRLAEYGGVLWMAAIAGESSLPAAFALLCVVAFRQYDLVYRLRYRGAVPPAWVSALTLGWDGRLVLMWVLLVAGALPAGLYVLAGLLALLLVGDTLAGWAAFGRADRPALYDDEEDEAA